MNRTMSDWQLLKAGFDAPNDAADSERDRELVVNVIFTTEAGTLAALKAAGDLGCDLNARINLIVAHAVPLAFPVDHPPVAVDFTERRLKALAGLGAQGDLETSVMLYLCRDRQRALLEALPPRSLVVLAGQRRRWGSDAMRTAKTLERNGHRVVFVPYR